MTDYAQFTNLPVPAWAIIRPGLVWLTLTHD